MIDPDKIPDAPYNKIAYANVILKSRYGKRHEFDEMMQAIDYLAEHNPSVLNAIDSIACDSKYGNSYTVKSDFDRTKDIAERQQMSYVQMSNFICEWLHSAFMEINNGHNGIYHECIVEIVKHNSSVDGEWLDEEFDCP